MNIVLIKRRKTHEVLSMTKPTEPWISEEQPEIFFLLCLNFQLLTPCIITCCAIWLVLIILVNIIDVINKLCLVIIMSFFFLFLIIIISFFLPFLVIVMYFFTITGCFYFPPLVLMSDKSILIFPCSWQKTVSGKEKHTCQMILLGKGLVNIPFCLISLFVEFSPLLDCWRNILPALVFIRWPIVDLLPQTLLKSVAM